MARRQENKLTALEVRRLKKPGRYADGGNLYLQISEHGGKSWQFRYMFNGRVGSMGLGPIDTITLLEARLRAKEARKLLLDGKDPLKVKQETRTARKLEAAREMTFREAATKFLASGKVGEFKNAVHRKQWKSTLENYAFPVIGDIPLQQIDTALILRTVAPVWKRTPETGSRLRGRIERVFDWAAPLGYFTGDNPAALSKLKDHMPKRPKAKPHESMPYVELAAFMEKLRERESLSAKALEFLILTASRTSEVIEMVWSEIDFAAKTWTIPAERMKASRDHRVPLSDRALAVLASVPRNGSAMVFPLSKAAMHQLLKGMDANGYTPHGFRAAFKTWAREMTSYSREVQEAALAHAVGDKTEAAYIRGDNMLDKRARLMADWARFCETPAISATVTPINSGTR